MLSTCLVVLGEKVFVLGVFVFMSCFLRFWEVFWKVAHAIRPCLYGSNTPFAKTVLPLKSIKQFSSIALHNTTNPLKNVPGTLPKKHSNKVVTAHRKSAQNASTKASQRASCFRIFVLAFASPFADVASKGKRGAPRHPQMTKNY